MNVVSVLAYNLIIEETFIRLKDTQVMSDATAYGTKAKYTVDNDYSDTASSVDVECYAAWKGAIWPYTCEETMTVAKGKVANTTVTQSKTSRFKIALLVYCN